RVVVVAYHTPIGRDHTTEQREDTCRDLAAVVRWFRLDSAEQATSTVLMLPDEFTHFVDGANAVRVALARRRAPGKQSVARQNDPVAFRVVAHCCLQQQREFESGALPWHPHQVSSELSIEL